MSPISGIRLGTADASLRYKNRDDLVVVVCDEETVVGGVFTQNRFCAAPVAICQDRLGPVRGLVINSGIANAATGQRGLDDATDSCSALASLIGCDDTSVLPFSTGVIGEFLPMDRMRKGIERAFSEADEDGWNRAASAILTTDTAPKGLSARFPVSGTTVTATGIVKGSGMLRPDMATLLAFVGTDAGVSESVATQLARDLAERSFNRLTIDGDTSTNDSFVILASARSRAPRVTSVASSGYEDLLAGLTPLARELAIRTVRDGEGATKFVTITVKGGVSENECLDVAFTIAHSPLVKTAVFAGDPNWGRFCMAIGRAGIENLDPSRVSLCIDSVPIAERGLVSPDYSEEAASRAMSEPEFNVLLDLGRGSSTAQIWTTDLSFDYISINAEYRT